jgi:hypothetical protein
MAVLPNASMLQSEQTVAPRYRAQVPKDLFSAVPHAIGSLGESLMNAGIAAEAQQKQGKDYELAKRWNDFQAERNKDYQDAQEGLDQNALPDGFADGVSQRYEEKAREFFKDVPENKRPEFDFKLDTLHKKQVRDAASDEQNLRDSYYTKDASSRLNNYGLKLSQDPSQHDAITQQARAEVDALPLAPAKKQKLYDSFAKFDEIAVEHRLRLGDAPEDIKKDLMPQETGAPAGSLPVGPAFISTSLETRETDPIKGIGSIASDTNGSTSYGNVGLNSQKGGSAWNFRDTRGEALGITADPGTPEFDDQWKAAAKDNAPALAAAENDWWQKNVASKVGDHLNKAGAGQFASDPRVQTYFADREVQQGPSSTTLHNDRVKQAAKAAGGDPVKFLEAMSEADRGKVSGDFSSYLRDNPDNKGGLENRVDNRLKLSLQVQGGAPAVPGRESDDGSFQVPGLDVRKKFSPDGSYGVAATNSAEPFKGIVVHATGDDKGSDADQVNYGQRKDASRGGSFGYHFYIGKDGAVYQGAPMDARTNHIMPMASGERQSSDSGGSIPLDNKNAIGVSFIGSEGSETPKQIASFQRLAASLGSTYKFDPHASTFGHGELQGNKMASEGAKAIAALREGAPVPYEGQAQSKYPHLTSEGRMKLLQKVTDASRQQHLEAVNNGIESIRQTGEAPVFDDGKTALDRAKLSQSLTPKQIEQYTQKWGAAQLEHKMIGGLEGMSPDEMGAHLEQFTPDPKSPDYKAMVDAQKRAEAAQTKILSMRDKDPALAVNGLGEVQQAYRELEQRRNPITTIAGVQVDQPVISSRDAWSNLISARLAAQSKVGISPNAQSPITYKEAEDLLALGKSPDATLATMDPNEAVDKLRDAASRAQLKFGPEYGSQAFQAAARMMLKGQNNRQEAAGMIATIASGKALTGRDIAAYEQEKTLMPMRQFGQVLGGEVGQTASESPFTRPSPQPPLPTPEQIKMIQQNRDKWREIDAVFGPGTTARALQTDLSAKPQAPKKAQGWSISNLWGGGDE